MTFLFSKKPWLFARSHGPKPVPPPSPPSENYQELKQRLTTLEAQFAKFKEQIMADVAALLARISANTDAIASIAAAADVLNEGHASIQEQIEDLKKQIADLGTPIDLSPLEAKLAEQSTVIAGLKDAVVKGTSLDPSANGG